MQRGKGKRTTFHEMNGRVFIYYYGGGHRGTQESVKKGATEPFYDTLICFTFFPHDPYKFPATLLCVIQEAGPNVEANRSTTTFMHHTHDISEQRLKCWYQGNGNWCRTAMFMTPS